MKTVQCTFRLPSEIVDLIDKQSGITRTDKLLNLLGYGCNQNDCSVIEERMEAVENRLSALENTKQVKAKDKTINQNISANQQRALEAKERVFSALNDLKSRDEIPLYRGKPSLTKLKEITGIDRGTISKYINEWLEM
ncbi:hypothetical protein [Photobacterium iliopiscarium]|uniref:hypothetical protein n=1 Tax=Photobacterium iliopiscarium TaxID=56192 RepID=UPI001E63A122|nr:hypothetical protein [Photobacterium iliopiscarium]MCD9468935.1 hypothetical protein [Photobacterium iliopiscarium]MCD9489185.1 hypothetical protein [Photobacterium iliopiscarium]MCF2245855.1 hypothetical protein [Photobacterium iliopiscarium]